MQKRPKGKNPANSRLSLQHPKAVVFDVGDTLVPATSIAAAALKETSRWLKRVCDIDQEGFLRAYQAADRSHSGPSVNHLWGLPLNIISQAFLDIGLHSQTLSLRAAATYRHSVRSAIGEDADLIHAFQALQERGVQIGIVSNGTVVEQLDTLVLLGVLDLTESTVISEAVGLEKPDPAIFQTVLDDLGVAAEQSWYLGDDPELDYVGAQEVGMTAIIVGSKGKPTWKRVPKASDVLMLFDRQD